MRPLGEPALAGKRATNVALTGQGAFDAFGSGHLGIVASPQTEELAYGFVARGDARCVRPRAPSDLVRGAR